MAQIKADSLQRSRERGREKREGKAKLDSRERDEPKKVDEVQNNTHYMLTSSKFIIQSHIKAIYEPQNKKKRL